jgi:glycosyltransferase involved in cell wall biosynthesis
MNFCDVTVVIPNYNRTTMLRRALVSVISQTVKPREVIIVDDNSDVQVRDEITALTEEFNGAINITLLLNERNRGANYSRNRGVYASSSRYVAFLDSDDLWMPNKLEIQMETIAVAKAKDSRPILSGTGRYRVDESGDIIARQFGGKVLTPEKIRRSNFIGTLSSIIVETWVVRHVHGFNENLAACQDWDLFIRLADYVQYVGVDKPLCIYTDHLEDRITLNNKKRLKSHLYIYKSYIRGDGNNDPAQHNEFFRNLAEDYQELGNAKKASLYYAKFRSLQKKSFAERMLPQSVKFCFYRSRGAPLLKAQRYIAYKKRMSAITRGASQTEELEIDAKTILTMMASSERLARSVEKNTLL